MAADFQSNAQAYCQDKLSTRQVANFATVNKTLLQTEFPHACLKSNIDLPLTPSGNYVYQHSMTNSVFIRTVSLYVWYEYRVK